MSCDSFAELVAALVVVVAPGMPAWAVEDKRNKNMTPTRTTLITEDPLLFIAPPLFNSRMLS